MPRGGYHAHAERWGRKKKWQSASVTKPIRVPEELAEQVLEIAHQLDEGNLSYVTKAKSVPMEAKKEFVTKAKKEEEIDNPRDLLVRVAWKLKRIAKGDDPDPARRGNSRKVPERVQAVVDEIEHWLSRAK